MRRLRPILISVALAAFALAAPALVAPALVAPAGAPAAAAVGGAPGTSLGGGPSLTYVRAGTVHRRSLVAARPATGGKVSSVKGTFSVTYHGFPSNAKAAFQRAVDLWSTLVATKVTVKVDATWEPLPEGVLGGAGPYDYKRNFGGAPIANTWYPDALANQLAGADLDRAHPEIQASFSSDVTDWYFGTDGATPSNRYDFESVVLHELGHGLGLVDSTEVSGTTARWGYGTLSPFVYDRFAQAANGTPISGFASPSAGLLSTLQSNALRWGGAQGVAANGGAKPLLYSPNPYELGSSVAHLDEDVFPGGDPDSLMTPYLDFGEAIQDPGDIGLGMLRDIGYQTAGARGIPAAPTITSAAVADQAVILGWRPAIDTGRQPITGYRVYRYDAGSATPSVTVDLSPTSTTLAANGLTNGTSYRFAVATRNASGVSDRTTSGVLVPRSMAPIGQSSALVRQQYVDFLGRQPSASELSFWLGPLNANTITPGDVITGVAHLADSADARAKVTRLYSAYFRRLPDYGGFTYWVGKLKAGTKLSKVSDTFAASSEFARTYGSLSNTAYVKLVYQNVLHRSPDSGGLSYWVGRLTKKTVTRGGVMLNFSESSENVRKMTSEVDSVLLRSGMLRAMPTKATFDADVAALDGGLTPADLATQIQALPAYAARFPV